MTFKEGVQLGEIDRSRVRGLLFDIDGTLSDTDDQMVNRLEKFFQPLRRLLSKDRDVRAMARRIVMAMENPGNLIYNLADRIGLDNFVAKLSRSNPHKKSTKKLKKGQFLLIPEVEEMLTSLKPHFKLGVVSARDAVSTVDFLEYFNLVHFFEIIVTGQTCQRTKPFPDSVLFAAEAMGLKPAACVMIGDTVVDIKAGQAAGMQTVGVLCGFGDLREIRRASPDLILSTTPALTNILLADWSHADSNPRLRKILIWI